MPLRTRSYPWCMGNPQAPYEEPRIERPRGSSTPAIRPGSCGPGTREVRHGPPLPSRKSLEVLRGLRIYRSRSSLSRDPAGCPTSPREPDDTSFPRSRKGSGEHRIGYQFPETRQGEVVSSSDQLHGRGRGPEPQHGNCCQFLGQGQSFILPLRPAHDLGMTFRHVVWIHPKARCLDL